MSQQIKVNEISNEGQRCILGEGPHWDVTSQSLFFVDIVASSIYRFNTKNGEIYKAKIKDNDEPIGFMIPVEGTTDEFVVGVKREVVIIRWDGKSALATVVRVLGEVDNFNTDNHINLNRLNDGKCDPKGRLFFGTMGDENSDLKTNPTGSFYRFKNSEAPTTKLKSMIGIRYKL
jgi:gluconolactonase